MDGRLGWPVIRGNSEFVIWSLQSYCYSVILLLGRLASLVLDYSHTLYSYTREVLMWKVRIDPDWRELEDICLPGLNEGHGFKFVARSSGKLCRKLRNDYWQLQKRIRNVHRWARVRVVCLLVEFWGLSFNNNISLYDLEWDKQKLRNVCVSGVVAAGIVMN